MNTTGWAHPADHNWLGVWTLYMREVRRFTKIYTQTMLAPVVTTLLFLAVFALAFGSRASSQVGGVPFIEFLGPGLIMMAMAQNAFANTSSSIVVAKVQGNIVDTLMPPFTPDELTLAISLGGATRGIAVGFVKFDHIAAVTNFVVTPLSFLSGTFYSIERLPELAQKLAAFNPFFYMIDGFRYGFIGSSDTNPVLGLAVMTGVNALLWTICRQMFKSGYRLKA